MADTNEGVHRLNNMTVEEVSLVDRAANKRKFLIAKREGSEDMNKLRSDGRGGFTAVAKADDDPAEETDEQKAEKAKGKPAFPGAAKPFGAGGEKDKDPPKPPKDPKDDEEKKKSAKAIADVAQELGALAKEMDDGDDEDEDKQMKKLISAHKSMSGVIAKYLKTAKAAGVQKVGAKMAAPRLSLLKDVLESLQTLFAELSDSPAKVKDHAPDAGDPQAQPTGWNKSNPSGAPGNAEGAAAIKSADPEKAEMKKALETLVDVNKTLLESNRRLSKKVGEIQNQVVPGNSRTVEKAGGGQSNEVAWPIDMAADIKKRNSNDPDSFL